MKLADGPMRVLYPFDAPAVAAGPAGADLVLEPVPFVMASLGKSYGYDKFASLWIALGICRFGPIA